MTAADDYPDETPESLERQAAQARALGDDLPQAHRQCAFRSRVRRCGERHRKLFDLARRLRDEVPPEADPGDLQKVVLFWWGLSFPHMRTKSYRANWHEFRDAWDNARVPYSQNHLFEKLRRGVAAAGPVPPAGRLRVLCGLLSEHTGGDFYLACRTAGELAGVGYRTAHRLLARFVADGVLTLVVPASARKRAPVFRPGPNFAEPVGPPAPGGRESAGGNP